VFYFFIIVSLLGLTSTICVSGHHHRRLIRYHLSAPQSVFQTKSDKYSFEIDLFDLIAVTVLLLLLLLLLLLFTKILVS
jgi:hypothetical protein